MMKKFIKILVAIIGVFLIILLVAPFFLKGKVEEFTKNKMSKQFDATVNWSDFSVSLIKKFPDLMVSMSDLNAVGLNRFNGDTLLSLNKFQVSVDLLSVIKGNSIYIETIVLDKPIIHAKVLADSTVNWDILNTKDKLVRKEKNSNQESSDFTVSLNHFSINDALITYTDETKLLDVGIYHFNLLGDLSKASSNIRLNTSIERVDVAIRDVKYLNGLKVSLVADIMADVANGMFTFKDNDLMLNHLKLGFDGSVGIRKEGYDFDMKMSTKETEFSAVLGLIPDFFATYTEGLETSGTFILASTLKGIYKDVDNLPAFSIALNIDEGNIKYSNLPKSINDINIDIQVNHTGGTLDNTTAEISTFHFALDQNPFDASLFLKTPVSNANFKGAMKGVINLGSLKEAIPMDGFDMKGIVDADIVLNANMESVDQEQHEDIEANGVLLLKQFYYASNGIPQSIGISEASMKLTPTIILLDKFEGKVGSSDFNLKGKIENYLPYVFKEGTIRGQLVHQSKYLDVNELLVSQTHRKIESTEDTITSKPIVVPKNIDLIFKSSVDKILYDKLEVNNARGEIIVRNGAVILEGMTMDLLDGEMSMTGEFNTQIVNKPYVDFLFNAHGIDIAKTAHSFSVIDSLMPLAKSAKGKVGAKFQYSSLLDKKMSPVISSIKGGGNIKSKSIEVSNSEVLNGMADLLKNDKYKTMTAGDINIDFIMEDSKVIVKPFNPEVYGSKLTIRGEQGFDQTLNYIVTAPISRKDVANVMSFLGGGFSSKGDDLMVDVIIKGTAKDPELNLDASKASKQLQKEVGNEVEKAILNVLEDENVQKSINNFLKGFGKKKK